MVPIHGPIFVYFLNRLQYNDPIQTNDLSRFEGEGG
jgi:hypothetical protein